MAKIKEIKAREILDSRGNPTVETTILLDNSISETASVPSGASVGTFEAMELRDNDPGRYHGMGVLRAVLNVNQIIAPKLIGANPDDQKSLDLLLISLDPTPNKATLGANAILSVSLGLAKVAAKNKNIPLFIYLNNLAKQYGISAEIKIPTPLFNIINGGKHGAGNLDFQEFHIIPASYLTFTEKLRTGSEIYHSLNKVLIYRNAVHSVGDEGGFAPNLFTNLDALEIIQEAILESGYGLGRNVFFGLDIAASHFKKQGGYQIKDKPSVLDSEDFIEYYKDINDQYHLLLLEDPLAEDDWKGWTNLTAKMGSHTIIVGDDLIATNLQRLTKAVNEKAANGVLVKPNQIGTLSETLEVISFAKKSDFKIVISHRSGETTDTFISDLSAAVSADYAKFGAPARGERVVKYNRLLQIEEEMTKLPS